MPEPITNPVELGFSEFVSKLISDTFEAVIASSLSQEENWIQLNDLLSKELEVFTDLTVDESMVENEVIRLFPDGSGGTTIVENEKYQGPNENEERTEAPPIEMLTGYKPKRNKLSGKDVVTIYKLIKTQLGKKQYEVLSLVFSKGATKVIVDAGKINAKLNFEILQVKESESEEETENNKAENKRIFVKRKLPLFGGLSKPIEMQNVHFFVKPPVDTDPQTHQIKANVYGEVEIQFKTIS